MTPPPSYSNPERGGGSSPPNSTLKSWQVCDSCEPTLQRCRTLTRGILPAAWCSRSHLPPRDAGCGHVGSSLQLDVHSHNLQGQQVVKGQTQAAAIWWRGKHIFQNIWCQATATPISWRGKHIILKHLMSSHSHPSVTANNAGHLLKKTSSYKTKADTTEFQQVMKGSTYPIAISENYSSKKTK